MGHRAVACGIEGRSVQLQTIGTARYSLYAVQVCYASVGRYLADAIPSGWTDAFSTLDFAA